MITHDDSKSFKCDVCLKVFYSKPMLERHYRMHTGEKPFECKICHRKFAEKVVLLKHQATHSKQIKNKSNLNNNKNQKCCNVMFA